ncbi:juvenile hormone acid O-methyltransferase [Caerostris extrusa]|uniref:Juvenile hormone acid O-methyltransferase n=1 Tax=Caerostris extrusa TaxID=172846 RepID=A0AAV4QGN8_CAEEX|nr:juvenile hormone acid O-methyltransferase [Caerostris extrusa]
MSCLLRFLNQLFQSLFLPYSRRPDGQLIKPVCQVFSQGPLFQKVLCRKETRGGKRSTKESIKMTLDAELYNTLPIPVDNVKLFFKNTLPELGFGKNNEKEIVLDVGCGPGGSTYHLVLPLFRCLKLFAVDMLPNMIEMARKHNSHHKIEYRVANIEDWSTVKEWEDQITKVVSIYCFHWLTDIRKGFYNVHRLLKTDGEAAICFGVNSYIPYDQFKICSSPYYIGMLEEIGFEILYCKEEVKYETFSSDEEYKNFFASISTVKSHIPVDQREEFKNELFDEMLKLEGRHKNGLPRHRGRFLELVIKKNE